MPSPLRESFGRSAQQTYFSLAARRDSFNRKQKALVEEQRRRFPDIENYPFALSKKLEKLRDDLTAEMLADNSGWQEILAMPEQVPDEVVQQE
jgi:hypothetical protein